MTKILENYREFDHSADLNAAIRIHLQDHRYKLTKTAFTVFEKISRYAVKHGGAAWLKMETLADMLGKSKPTIRRAVALLESLGIVERVAQMRPKRGGNGGNIIRILPPNERPEMSAREDAAKPVVPTDEAVNAPKESTTLKSFKRSLVPNTYEPAAPSAVPTSFYGRFKELAAKVNTGGQPLVSRLYGIYKAQTAALVKHGAFDKEIVEHIAYEALRKAITDTKTKNIRSLTGWYNGVLNNMLDDYVYEDSRRALAEGA